MTYFAVVFMTVLNGCGFHVCFRFDCLVISVFTLKLYLTYGEPKCTVCVCFGFMLWDGVGAHVIQVWCEIT